MIYNSLEFHNVAELYDDGLGGLRLQRVPEAVRCHLNEGAQEKTLAAAATEIRFVTSGDRIRITLSSASGNAELIPFYGPLQGKQRFLVPSEPTTFEIVRRQNPKRRFDDVTQSACAFSPDVWRLTLRGPGVRYHGIDGDGLCPPTKAQLPNLRYLSYGTSITQGMAASAGHLTYAAQTAWRLQADLINLGLGGAAWCEPELADYIAARDDWDFATLELSVNMLGAGFSDEVFQERTRYMLDRLAQAYPDKPVFCITIFPHFRDFAEDPAVVEHSERFRLILRQVCAQLGHPNLKLIEGPELLAAPSGLAVDLLHPGDHGMIQIGEHLASKIQPMLVR